MVYCAPGKYLTIPRTEGISTTDIVGRMLLMTRAHHSAAATDSDAAARALSPAGRDRSDTTDSYVLASGRTPKRQTNAERYAAMIGMGNNKNSGSGIPFDRKTNFLTTSRTIRLFGAGVKVPRPGDRVVYLAGAWDMFHAGHIETLQEAKK